MSLPHAILGLLQIEPMTGYDLKTIWFDNSIAHFWTADHTQIYRTLDKLAEQGFVESRIEYQENHPNRKVYTITETGLAELQRWLSQPQPPATIRDPFLIQFFFGDLLSNAELEKVLNQQLQIHQQKLTHYETKLAGMQGQAQTRGLILRMLTVERGIGREKSYIEWLHKAKATLQTLPDRE